MMQRVVGLLVITASVLIGWYWMAYQSFLQQSLAWPSQDYVLTVERGTNLRSIAKDLAEQDIIQQPDWLYWHARYTGQANKIRAGEYAIPADTTVEGLLGILVAGKTLSYQLTLLEGWNIYQVLAAVRANPVLKQTLLDVPIDQLMHRIGRTEAHPEGRFFPDTYAFPRGTTDAEFLQRAAARMDEQLAAAWAARNAQANVLKSPDEALILASIVEKETGVPYERPEIAGVFSRRLQKGMKLQTDPTIIYGIWERFDGNIRRKDIRENTPYNTYVHKGLPPTPIAMPGRAALDAVLDPAPGKALYFVSKGDGSHVFSATLKQHNAAVRRYQLKK